MSQTWCEVCLEHFDLGPKCPLLLSCGHTFCAECIARLHGLAREKGDVSIECPIDRSATACGDGPESLPRNMYLLKEASNTAAAAGAQQESGTAVQPSGSVCVVCTPKHAAVARCVDCGEDYCDAAASFHKGMKLTREHTVLRLEGLKNVDPILKRSALCTQHGDAFRLFDNDSNQLICNVCAASSHKGHKLQEIPAAAGAARNALAGLVARAQAEIKLSVKGEKAFEERIAVLHARVPVVEASVRAAFTEIRAAVEAREKELLEEVAHLQKAAFFSLSEHLESVRIHRGSVQSIMGRVEHVLASQKEPYLVMGDLELNPAFNLLLQRAPAMEPSKDEACTFEFESNDSWKALLADMGAIQKFVASPAHSRLVLPYSSFPFVVGLKQEQEEQETAEALPKLLLEVRNKDGLRVHGGGDTVEAYASRGQQILELSTVDNKDGTYSIFVSALSEGTTYIIVRLNGRMVGEQLKCMARSRNQEESNAPEGSLARLLATLSSPDLLKGELLAFRKHLLQSKRTCTKIVSTHLDVLCAMSRASVDNRDIAYQLLRIFAFLSEDEEHRNAILSDAPLVEGIESLVRLCPRDEPSKRLAEILRQHKQAGMEMH